MNPVQSGERLTWVARLFHRSFPQALRIDIDDERRRQDQAADQNLQEREVRVRFHWLARGNSHHTQSRVQARIPIAGRNGGSSSGEGGIGE